MALTAPGGGPRGGLRGALASPPSALPGRGPGAAGPARTEGGSLTDAARLGDFVESPEQITPQLLDVDEVVQHGVGEVHQVVQVDGVALGPPEGHVEGSRLTCR